MEAITNAIITFFQELFNHNDILTIIFISLFPIIELRGAIPVAISLEMPWYSAYFFSFLGASIPAPFLLLLLMPILKAMKKCKGFRSLAEAVESVFKGKAQKIQSKADAQISEKKALIKKMIGVFAFVAVPLPLTGVWTGSAVAVFLGLKFWQALPMVLLGNLVAGGIMTLLSECFAEYVDIILFVFMMLVIVIILFYIAMLTYKIVKKKKLEKANSKDNEVNLVEENNSESKDEIKVENDDVIEVVEDENNESIDEGSTDFNNSSKE